MANVLNDNLNTSKKETVLRISFIHGVPFVWNSKDGDTLRKEYRIVGNLVGCLPRALFQNTHLGLPLQLSNEEAKLLLEKGYAELVHYNQDTMWDKTNSESNVQEFFNFREKLYSEQNELHKAERKRTILSMAADIVEGKRKRQIEKLNGLKGRRHKKKKTSAITNLKTDIEINMDPDAVIAEEMEKIADVPRESCAVQLFMEPFFPGRNSGVSSEFKYPDTDENKMRYQVFKDLWEKKYFITSGSKFGVDFLAYPGDPLRYHAFFMVACVAYGQNLSQLELVTLGRLSTQVKKTLVLATVKPDDQVDYISLKWSGKILPI